MSMKRVKLALAVTAISALLSASVFAGQSACDVTDWPQLQPRDEARMSRLELSRTKGLAAALGSSNNADRELVSDLFDEDFVPIKDMYEIGKKYRCRTIKLGGITDITIYQWFNCEFNPEGKVLTIRKTTGSQNFFGVLVPAGNGLSYSGALNYGYESVHKLYGEDEERNQVGCLSAKDKNMNRLVLELPEPKFESVHDVILFERVN